jgi:hypothetical protein
MTDAKMAMLTVPMPESCAKCPVRNDRYYCVPADRAVSRLDDSRHPGCKLKEIEGPELKCPLDFYYPNSSCKSCGLADHCNADLAKRYRAEGRPE